MNRLKLWLYTLLLLGAGVGNLYYVTGWVSARSIKHVDDELRSAAAVADARVRLLGSSVALVADAAARSPAVVAALADPAAKPLAPAEDAAQAAASALRAELEGALVAVAGPQEIAARAGGANGKTIAAPEALLAEAQAGKRVQAWARLDGTLWMIAAAPAGRGGAIAVGVPLDATYAQSLSAATGVAVTAVVDGKVAATTLPPADATATAGASSTPARRAVDVGRLGSVKPLDWSAPAMPILFASAPAARALALPLEGAGPAMVVLSQATAPAFSALAAYQLLALVAIALFLVVGIVLGLLMSEESADVGFPRELLAAADRVAHGDFSARAPSLAGSAGTISNALNRAADAAEHARGPTPSAAAVPAPERAAEVAAAPAEVAAAAPAEVATAPTEPAPAAEPQAVTAADSAAPAQELASTAPEGASLTQPLFPPAEETPASVDREEPAPAAEAFRDEAPPAAASDGVGERQPFAEAAPAEAPLEGDAVGSPAEGLDEDERHWRSVFDDFVRLRSVTGEAADNVSYDRFRARLERNREQLRQKHGARTVRFQPYVKDGKVALRATPVK